MAITAITSGSVVVNLPVNFTAADLTEINTEVTANPGTYSGKVIKALDTGFYHFIDNADVVSTGTSNILQPVVAVADGPVDLTSNKFTFDVTTQINNLDPTGSGSDGCSILVLTNSTGLTRQVRGIVAPTTGKTMVIYNEGPNNISLRNNNANAMVNNRFDMGGNLTLGNNEGVWTYYDVTTSKWRCIKF